MCGTYVMSPTHFIFGQAKSNTCWHIYTYGKHIVSPLYTHLQIQPNFEQMFGNIQCIIRILYIYFTQRRETVL